MMLLIGPAATTIRPWFASTLMAIKRAVSSPTGCLGSRRH
jgi:hypothetical protein